MLDPTEALREFSERCIRCNLCARTDCGNFAQGTPNLGEICESLLAGDETWRHFPFTCALCNRCTLDCPAGLDAKDACKPLRALILPQHPELRGLYRHFRTDRKHNLFYTLRSRDDGDIANVDYIEGEPGLNAEADRTAFFPGCSLFAYAPELTAKVSQWLREEGIAAFTLYFCCGASYYDCGFFPEWGAYRERVQAFLAQRGIERLVVTCPHCDHILPDLLEGTGIELLKLPELLVQRGMGAPDTCRVSFHDACYDRAAGAFGTAARALFGRADIVPLPHEREQTRCCGGGGLVSAYAPTFCEYRRNQRLAELDSTGTDEVVSTCFSCVNSMQRGSAATPVRHYLECVFGVDMDWPAVYARVDAFYADPLAQELLSGDEPAL